MENPVKLDDKKVVPLEIFFEHLLQEISGFSQLKTFTENQGYETLFIEYDVMKR
jgi:hypothetical protein